MAYTFVRYYGTVMNELSVCTACRKILPPPKRGWGSQRPHEPPPKPVPNLMKGVKLNKARRVRHSSNITKVLRDLHDSNLRQHPYGVALRKVLLAIRERIRNDLCTLHPRVTWRELLTDEERLELYDAALHFKKGVRMKADIDRFLLIGD